MAEGSENISSVLTPPWTPESTQLSNAGSLESEKNERNRSNSDSDPEWFDKLMKETFATPSESTLAPVNEDPSDAQETLDIFDSLQSTSQDNQANQSVVPQEKSPNAYIKPKNKWLSGLIRETMENNIVLPGQQRCEKPAASGERNEKPRYSWVGSLPKKNYKCLFCDQGLDYRHPNGRRIHVAGNSGLFYTNTRDKKRMYVCNVPNCFELFERSDEWREHNSKHDEFKGESIDNQDAD